MQREERLTNRQNVNDALATLGMWLPAPGAPVKPAHIKRLATEILRDLAGYRGDYNRDYASLVAHITVELDSYRLVGFTSDVSDYEVAKADTRRLYSAGTPTNAASAGTPTNAASAGTAPPLPNVTAKLARLRHSYDTAWVNND